MIVVVDNGSKYAPHIGYHLRKLDQEYRYVDPGAPAYDSEAVILSGGPELDGYVRRNEIYFEEDPTREAYRPVLGICLGWEIMAELHGGSVRRDSCEIDGMVDVDVVDEDDPLVGSLPDDASFYADHNNEVSNAGEFDITSTSREVGIQSGTHPDQPWYGVQFHPECEESGDHGREIYSNFVDIVSEWRNT